MPYFQIKPHPDQSPTQCAICQSHEGPVIDTETVIPGYGKVYICIGNDVRSGCLVQYATAVGMASRADHAELLTKHEELATEHAKTVELLDEEIERSERLAGSIRDEVLKMAASAPVRAAAKATKG